MRSKKLCRKSAFRGLQSWKPKDLDAKKDIPSFIGAQNMSLISCPR
ncbi:UNVERIFIED_CONTAM: hypothetical protein GTU68_060315 [Idotea baltica]|nr:hypothetical protein [Idotea baltica]